MLEVYMVDPNMVDLSTADLNGENHSLIMVEEL